VVQFKKTPYIEKKHIPGEPPAVIEILLTGSSESLWGFVFAVQFQGLGVEAEILG